MATLNYSNYSNYKNTLKWIKWPVGWQVWGCDFLKKEKKAPTLPCHFAGRTDWDGLSFRALPKTINSLGKYSFTQIRFWVFAHLPILYFIFIFAPKIGRGVAVEVKTGPYLEAVLNLTNPLGLKNFDF